MSDLISREEAIEEIESVWNSISGLHPHLDDTMALYADIKRIVKQLPSAYPKKGRWIHRLGSWFHDDYQCSECGNFLDFNGLNAGRGDANFCPNCGARMDAGRKDE